MNRGTPQKIGPFFKYFGGKHRHGKQYPAPQYDLIVEPFAGSAGYACRWHDRDVLLNDADPRVAALWLDLQGMDPADLRVAPDIPEGGGAVVDLPPQFQRLASCWVNSAPWCTRPCSWMRSGQTSTSWWGVGMRARVADWLPAISHWDVRCGGYADLPDVEATWFVDPPYQGLPGMYKKAQIDYAHLAEWCRTRRGQVIVCENEGADWLPFAGGFTPGLTAGKITQGDKVTSRREVMWTGGRA